MREEELTKTEKEGSLQMTVVIQAQEPPAEPIAYYWQTCCKDGERNRERDRQTRKEEERGREVER